MQHVRRIRTTQPVVERRAGQPLDPVIGIALRVAAQVRTAIEADVDASG